VFPDEFIPILEQYRLIGDVGLWVLEQALIQCKKWRETLPQLRISVNFSALQFEDVYLADKVIRKLESTGLPGDALTVEVTESLEIQNRPLFADIIRQLKKYHVNFALDDFGSGYSSLNMLSSMPIDVLKMDIAFIRNIERNERDLRLVELIVDIARYLKVPVVAEGVETENQLKLLRNAGCDLVQGYYFSPPLPAGEFEQKILRNEAAKG
jgi:EAL domain-containing protein (putative c-di-GMP-specific phosphodiesterase class I)